VESRILIVLTADGELRVTTQGDAQMNRVAALGMLSMALQVLMQPRPAAAPPLLVANGSLPR